MYTLIEEGYVHGKNRSIAQATRRYVQLLIDYLMIHRLIFEVKKQVRNNASNVAIS
jgi:hypothetical protein